MNHYLKSFHKSQGGCSEALDFRTLPQPPRVIVLVVVVIVVDIVVIVAVLVCRVDAVDGENGAHCT